MIIIHHRHHGFWVSYLVRQADARGPSSAIPPLSQGVCPTWETQPVTSRLGIGPQRRLPPGGQSPRKTLVARERRGARRVSVRQEASSEH